MARLTDILILLDQQSVIHQILFSEGFSDDKLRVKILRWQGVEITKIPDTEWDFNQGTVRWNGLRFELIRFSLNSFTQCLLLRREPLRERLMEAALDFMDDGIQLYGSDAFALAESGALRPWWKSRRCGNGRRTWRSWSGTLCGSEALAPLSQSK